jgi:hypothetical protein
MPVFDERSRRLDNIRLRQQAEGETQSRAEPGAQVKREEDV